MIPARNLELPGPLGPAQRKSSRREAGTHTTTDIAVVDYQKRNGGANTRVLTTLAERHNFTRKAPMTVAEIQVETNLGERAVEKALKALQEAGFCYADGRAWRYGKSLTNDDANRNANNRASLTAENAVLHGKPSPLKEVEGNGRKLNNTISRTGELWLGQIPPTDVGGVTSQKNEPAMDGVASSDANDDEKDFISPDKHRAEIGSHAVLETYRDAQEALVVMGVWETWQAWTRAHRPKNAVHNLQICQFATWAVAGLGTELRQNAVEITVAGSFVHPFLALNARMKLAQDKQAAQQSGNIGGGTTAVRCQAGECRRDPQSGLLWIVEAVAYGSVTFEEFHAPSDVSDAEVATWELVE